MPVPEILYQRAIDAGFTIEGACSLLANIQGESAFRCDNAEDRINRVISDEEYIRRADAGLVTYNGKNFIYDEVGFGYAQWTFWSRKKFLYEFCKGRGVSIADHEAQKEFIFVEMERDFPGIWKLCRTSHNLDEIMHQLVWVWENPADKNAAMTERMPYARTWLAKFTSWSKSASEKIETVETVKPATSTEPTTEIEVHWPPRTINAGLNWPEVYLLQSLLNLRGYNVVVNGIFGSYLTGKVKKFQEDHKLDADGIVGPLTWCVLLELPAGF